MVKLMPMNARENIAENKVGMSRLLCATMTTLPKPLLALKYSPTTAPITALTAATFIPENIDGKE